MQFWQSAAGGRSFVEFAGVGHSRRRAFHQAVAPALDRYCGLHRGNGLILVDANDEFYASILPLARTRYTMMQPLPPSPAIDYAWLGIWMPASQFTKLRPVAAFVSQPVAILPSGFGPGGRDGDLGRFGGRHGSDDSESSRSRLLNALAMGRAVAQRRAHVAHGRRGTDDAALKNVFVLLGGERVPFVRSMRVGLVLAIAVIAAITGVHATAKGTCQCDRYVRPRATASQLTGGFYGLEGNKWRWTSDQFSVVLQPPPGADDKGGYLQARVLYPGRATG